MGAGGGVGAERVRAAPAARRAAANEGAGEIGWHFLIGLPAWLAASGICREGSERLGDSATWDRTRVGRRGEVRLSHQKVSMLCSF